MPFAPGLNVLTGETGAGKSIVVDALLLITGARAQLDWIRTGADTALVEAVFEIDPAGPVAALLDEAGHHPGDGQLVIKRELARSGRHRAFVNDGAATVGLLERLGELLVELHGQHEHQRLMEPARQLLLLDRFAEALDRARARGGAGARVGGGARAPSIACASEMREGARQEDLYRFQLAEIDDVRLQDGEEDELRAERSRLQHAERIVAGLAGDGRRCSTRSRNPPPRGSAARPRSCATSRATSRTRPPPSRPSRARRPTSRTWWARARALRDRAVFDPERLEQIDARLDAIVKLKRKYGRLGGGDPRPPSGSRDRARPHHAPRRDRGGDGARGGRGGGRGGGGGRRALAGPHPRGRAPRAAHPEGDPRARDGARPLPRGPPPRAGGGRASSPRGRTAGGWARAAPRAPSSCSPPTPARTCAPSPRSSRAASCPG